MDSVVQESEQVGTYLPHQSGITLVLTDRVWFDDDVPQTFLIFYTYQVFQWLAMKVGSKYMSQAKKQDVLILKREPSQPDENNSITTQNRKKSGETVPVL